MISVLFLLFLFVAAFTFTKEVGFASRNNFQDTMSAVVSNGEGNMTTKDLQVPTLVSTGRGYGQKINAFLNTNASLIVAIWFIIFSARFVKLIADIGYAHRIRHYKTSAVSQYWQSKLLDLARSLNIKKNIRLLESTLVKVPVMTGFFKPVILFPFGLIMQIPAEQVEAVLLHELAHIRRKDYLVNLAQSFAETIFFFNPGVIWISSLIREERENCCDDIAIQHTKNRTQFIHALVAFQEYNINEAKYAMAFPGKKNQLLQRAKRILQNDNKTLNIMQKFFLTSGLVIAGLLTVVFAQTHKPAPVTATPAKIASKPTPPAAQKNEIAEVPEKIVAVPEVPEAAVTSLKSIVSAATVGGVSSSQELYKIDTLPAVPVDDNFRGILESIVDGKKYEIVVFHGKATELYIDGKRIPDEKISLYKNVVDKIIKDARERAALSKLDADHAKAEADLEMLKLEAAKSTAESDKISAEKAKMLADKARVEASLSLNESSEMEARVLKEKILAEAAKEKSDKDKTIMEEIISGIISDLKTDGLVKDENNLSFSLDKNGLIVDGVKQPASLFSKYKKKYMKNETTNFSYSKLGSSQHISVNDNN